MTLKNGTTLLNGKYILLCKLGQGGFGCTYKARNVLLNKTVAIKEFFLSDYCNRDASTWRVTVGIDSKVSFVEKLKNRFIREAQTLANFKHPNIVSVTDVFKDNGTAYYVMDYIEGTNLEDKTKATPCLSEGQALKYIRDVCDALKYIHNKGHLHLDVKPGNIMVNKEDRAILIDFGSSKKFVEDSGGTTLTTFGLTPGYGAPEQHSENSCMFSQATDIYSVGATLYKLLTGNAPLDAMSRASERSQLPLPSYVSAPTKRAIMSALSLSRKDRPQTIDSFLKILDNSDSHDTKVITDHSGGIINNRRTWLISCSVIVALFLIVIGVRNSDKIGSLIANDSSDSITNTSAASEAVKADTLKTTSIHSEGKRLESNKTAETTITTDVVESEPAPLDKELIISEPNYNARYRIHCTKGLLTVTQTISGNTEQYNLKTNRNVDLKKILDQFEGLAYYWAACETGANIINEYGTCSEEYLKATIRLLSKSANALSVNRGNSPIAYDGAKSREKMLRDNLNNWNDNSPREIEMITWGMGENPIKTKDIQL